MRQKERKNDFLQSLELCISFKPDFTKYMAFHDQNDFNFIILFFLFFRNLKKNPLKGLKQGTFNDLSQLKHM